MEKKISQIQYASETVRENSKEFLLSFLAFFFIIVIVSHTLHTSLPNSSPLPNRVLAETETKKKGPRLEPLSKSSSEFSSITASPRPTVSLPKEEATVEIKKSSSPTPSVSISPKSNSISSKPTPKLVPIVTQSPSVRSILPLSSPAPSPASFVRKIAEVSEIPVRVVVEKVGIDVEIQNPEKSDVATLDEALKKGAVRHPDSGFLGENANVLLLGHSSHLKVVYNKAYRSFNELGLLAKGDEIKVFSLTKTYVYRVTSVILMKESEAQVALHSLKPKLTLVTCDNFGAKEDRFIVEAELVGSFLGT